MRIKPGGIRLGVEARISDIYYPVTGNTATDGVVYSSVATFSTATLTLYNALIDPRVTLGLRQLGARLTAKFTGINGSIADTAVYWWSVTSEADVLNSSGSLTKFTGDSVRVTPTMGLLVGTLLSVENTLSQNSLNIGSIPYAPIRIRLHGYCTYAGTITVAVKNSTLIRHKGIVIPGT